MVTNPQVAISPLKIHHITIDNPYTLAPMAGHTNIAFRKLVRELGGCGLVCTELISSHALNTKGMREQSLKMFDWDADESPIAVQLFGNDASKMAEAARIVVDHGADIVDINMGCWVPKIAKKGGGAALLRDINVATEVVEAVVNAVDVPVTVKVRTGFEDGIVTAVPFAQAAEKVGAAAIAVHARFAGQGHGGDADWDIIRDVKNVVTTLPVIGNGDVHTGEDAVRMLTRTGCDGVMVGRGALGSPWVFKQIAHYVETGETLPAPSRAERAKIALQHAQLTMDLSPFPEKKLVLEFRGQISKYNLDEVGSKRIRNQIVRVETFEQLKKILIPIIESDENDA